MSGELLAGAVIPVKSLYRPWYDRLLVFGPLGAALGLGALASLSPELFVGVVLVDIWLFASPHVIATYTRIGCDGTHIKKHWVLIFLLPPIVLVLVTMTALAYELGGLFTLYFFAQAYHVTRQSFGISRAYSRADPHAAGTDRLAEGLIYLLPAWGLLHRCAEASSTFYGHALHLPEVSPVLANAAGAVAAVACVGWLSRQIRLAWAGQLNTGHSLFVASHLLVNAIAYVWVTDITLGWLVVNIWHNLQYLLFVWMQNMRRETQLSGRLGEPLKNAGKYLAICLVVGIAMYEALNVAGRQLMWLGLPAVFILHFTVNFHHYLVDGVIWKRRKRVAKPQGLATAESGAAP